MTCDAYCEGCYYFGAAHQTCDYWEKADELRGCPPGKGCIRKITKKEYMKMATQKSWNKAAGYEMFKAGKSDKEIGEALGVTAATVSYYRKKYWDGRAVIRPELVPVKSEEEEASQPEPDDVIQTEAAADETPVTEISAEECGEPEASPQEDKEESDAKMMIRALEIFVQNLKGMKAVMTFQILQALWDWETVEDLERAKLGLEYLIELEGGKA